MLNNGELTVGNTIGGYCGNINDLISGTGTYDFDVYKTYGDAIAFIPSHYDGYPLGALNWVANQDHAILESGVQGEQLQALVWLMIHDGQSGIEATIASKLNLSEIEVALLHLSAQEALTHSDFVPQTGDWTIVLLDPIETYNEDLDCTNCSGTDNIQLVIVKVDP